MHVRGRFWDGPALVGKASSGGSAGVPTTPRREVGRRSDKEKTRVQRRERLAQGMNRDNQENAIILT